MNTLLSAYTEHRAQAEWLQAAAIWAPNGTPAARRAELRAQARYHQRIAQCVFKRMRRL